MGGRGELECRVRGIIVDGLMGLGSGLLWASLSANMKNSRGI